MNFRRFILVLFNIWSIISASARSDTVQIVKLAERLHALALNAPPELAYIQTSKDIYETGEDLWFKVYLLDAQYLIPSGLSKTLYLQLLNENTKKAVWQEKYEIQNGFANGQVYLDNKLSEGYYLLSVFTPNSFSDDTAGFYAVRKIKVVQDISSRKESMIVPVPVDANPIQFTSFPEGGNLVSGLQNTLAFKAVNIKGEPVDIKGTLFEDNIPLVDLKCVHAGMGSINFLPHSDKKYFIRLSEPSVDSTYMLPDIYPAGIIMRLIRRDNESLSFKVSESPTLPAEDIYLRVQCRGEVYGITMATLNRELIIKVSLAELPQGISEVTLFNSNMDPVAERLVYINRDKSLKIEASLSEEIYPTRGKATLKITVKDEKGQPATANLGVTVFDKLYQNPDYSINIITHCFLSSQLKGRIYNPSFYFNPGNNDRDEALDLLMLTQGWRKYVWNEINLKKQVVDTKKIVSDGITGEISDPTIRKKLLREHLFVIAYSPNKDSNKVVIPADLTGKFNVTADRLKEWENDYVYLKPLGPYESQRQKKEANPLAPPEFNFQIKLKDPFETINRLLKYNEFIYPLPALTKWEKDTTDLYKVESNMIRIKEVTIKGKNAKTIRGKFLGSLDSIEMAKADDDYVCRYGILNCPNHNRNEPGSIKPIQGHTYRMIINNNTPGARARNITYWRPKYSETELLKINNLWRVKAYYGNREFYKPNYDQDNGEEIIPDFRNTLLWEPSVITDEKGEAVLSFYCSDINTDFVGRIEGVSGNGLLGTGNFKFSVRKLKITQ